VKSFLAVSFIVVFATLSARADGPADNLADKVRPVPPPGVAIPDADRKELEGGVAELGKEIDELRSALAGKPLLDLLPDVQIYHNAVRYALTYNEFFNLKEVPVAKTLLKQGMERAKVLRDGKAPWTTATGLVVRGYISKIDGSVQPYGLVVPESYQPKSPYKHRLDLWWHGRGETLSELNFIDQRQKSPGEFTPPHAFVLHPYGRYCNANKFAGEIDTLEAIEHVKKHYPIDEDRIVARGFSMGGAACWQFAVHYPGMWCAAAPGAGFAETPEFLRIFQKEKVEPTWYEKKLWHLYDCTDYVANLYNCPVVAYSGENDAQKQAADIMAEAIKRDRGRPLVHVIGPKTGHSYHPEAKRQINRRIDAIAARGRERIPETIRFATWTLRYNRVGWVQIDGLQEHWKKAELAISGVRHGVSVQTHNVSAFTLAVPPGGTLPFELEDAKAAISDLSSSAQDIDLPPVLSDRSWTAHFRKEDGRWKVVDKVDDGELCKRHGLQGPIDDAFTDSFLMVRPTGKPMNDKVGAWASAEMKHAIEHWRKQFRGEARVKDDNAVSADDIAAHNLVLWGDPSSNQILAKIAPKLPIRWDDKAIHVGEKTYDASHHVPVLIYPNPLNPKRYVVLNSGFTFREYDYLNNARQVPKRPDWAIIDVNVPPSPRAPGKVVDAAFFGERWELLKSNGK
jgi:pimeloyl-ACP methyl ester carboxylesterase